MDRYQKFRKRIKNSVMSLAMTVAIENQDKTSEEMSDILYEELWPAITEGLNQVNQEIQEAVNKIKTEEEK